jgi:hypothetical protein
MLLDILVRYPARLQRLRQLGRAAGAYAPPLFTLVVNTTTRQTKRDTRIQPKSADVELRSARV